MPCHYKKHRIFSSLAFDIGIEVSHRLTGSSSIAVGFKRDRDFRYAGKLEVYLRRAIKTELLQRFVNLACSEPRFAHVPRKRAGDSWSAGIAAEELTRFIWLKPSIKATVQFQEWTRTGYLRHAKIKTMLGDN
jgi:ATP-dependent DNA ligase